MEDKNFVNMMNNHQQGAPIPQKGAQVNRGSKFAGRQAQSLDKKGYVTPV
jgi:hypothetical protein